MGQQDDPKAEVDNQSQNNVSQPDDSQVAAPTNDNQQGKDQPKPEDSKPKETEAKEAEEDAILPDEDAGKDEEKPDEGKPDEGKKPKDEGEPDEGEPEKPTEADSPEEKARKEQARENYFKRQLDKKDEVIDTLTEQLQDNYINQGKDDQDKRLRSLEADKYISNIREARSSLVSDNQRVESEIAVFNPKSPDFIGQEAVEKIKARYARDNVILKPIQLADGSVSNEIVGYRQPLYAYMEEEAEVISGVSKRSADKVKEETANVNSMAAEAETTPGGSSPKKPSDKKDPFEEGFDSVA